MKKICFLMAIVLILAISACISLPSEKMTIKTGTLTVGVFKHAPPAVYEQNGKLIGFEVELVSEIAKRMNLNVEFKEYMFSNLLNAVANNKVDCAISDISISPEREKIVSFTRAYSHTELVVLVRKESGIQTITDLNGKKIGVVDETIHETKAKSLQKSMDFEIVEYETPIELYNDLNNGKIDATISEMDNFKVSSYMNQLDLIDTLEILYSGIAVNKDNKELLHEMDRVLLELETEGYIEELKQKWSN
ncbi:ABC transporter substrate-binding protein [Methanococcus maripaludis]|uniref:Polar amino acid transport system substrate-binding protein n=1 Tax=Methanococcus maripaludis TaxID=39152 RepID=A0A7J9SHU5_METMI|nr:ABC transporter substrate-binding protein [Methanococcus maripaludis]MBB6497764.1 polar amino acid transport system substrate-binding protein [Methanococcus maripaludis]